MKVLFIIRIIIFIPLIGYSQTQIKSIFLEKQYQPAVATATVIKPDKNNNLMYVKNFPRNIEHFNSNKIVKRYKVAKQLSPSNIKPTAINVSKDLILINKEVRIIRSSASLSPSIKKRSVKRGKE